MRVAPAGPRRGGAHRPIAGIRHSPWALWARPRLSGGGGVATRHRCGLQREGTADEESVALLTNSGRRSATTTTTAREEHSAAATMRRTRRARRSRRRAAAPARAVAAAEEDAAPEGAPREPHWSQPRAAARGVRPLRGAVDWKALASQPGLGGTGGGGGAPCAGATLRRRVWLARTRMQMVIDYVSRAEYLSRRIMWGEGRRGAGGALRLPTPGLLRKPRRTHPAGHTRLPLPWAESDARPRPRPRAAASMSTGTPAGYSSTMALQLRRRPGPRGT